MRSEAPETQPQTPKSVHYMLGRIEAKVDLLLEQSKDHEERISSLERGRYWAIGVVTMLAFFGKWLWDSFTTHLQSR